MLIAPSMMRVRPAVGDGVPPGATQILAELEGCGVVGRVVIYPADEGGVMLVTALRVDPQYRRRGIGRELMRAAAEHAAEHGATIRFRIAEGNAGAKAFFAAIGLVQN